MLKVLVCLSLSRSLCSPTKKKQNTTSANVNLLLAKSRSMLRERMPVCPGIDVSHTHSYCCSQCCLSKVRYLYLLVSKHLTQLYTIRLLQSRKSLFEHFKQSIFIRVRNNLRRAEYSVLRATPSERYLHINIHLTDPLPPSPRPPARNRINGSFEASTNINSVSRGQFPAHGDELTDGTIIARKATAVRFSTNP